MADFDITIGIDMETDVGSFTDFYEGIQHGTYRLLEILANNGAKATFFWTGHAATNKLSSFKVQGGYQMTCFNRGFTTTYPQCSVEIY